MSGDTVHLLNAYTWAGRRAACGLTSQTVHAAHDLREVDCPGCIEAAADPVGYAERQRVRLYGEPTP